MLQELDKKIERVVSWVLVVAVIRNTTKIAIYFFNKTISELKIVCEFWHILDKNFFL